MSFTRPCPKCGKEMSYKNEYGLMRAIKNNNLCRYCAHKGKTFSEETKRKISESKKGRKLSPLSEETKRKISMANKGRTFSEETRRKISERMKGNNYRRGKTLSEETRIKLSLAGGGDGVLDKDRFNRSKLARWSNDVRKRDNYTCQYCGTTEGRLESHHIFPKSRFPSLAFDINNGRTLCQSCHIEEHKLYATDYFQDLFQTFSDFA